jgi:hypothetical protein
MDVGIGVFDGAVKVDVIPMVHDSIIAGDFGASGVF